ncbi:MAG: flippase-like domain-containing protein [Planctomycetes bacterium]|nr:flippase-like domain-containing protein [Planctomycetota bacterium]
MLTILGVAAVAAIVWQANAAQTLASLGRAGWEGFALLFAAGASVLVSQTIGWWILLRAAGIPATFRMTLEAMTVGFLVAYLTPSMYLGGEPVRTLMIARSTSAQRRRVLGTVLVHKFAEFFGFLAAIAVAVFAAAGSFDLAPSVRHALWGGLGLFALLFLLFTVALLGQGRPLERFCLWRASAASAGRSGRGDFWRRAAERAGGMEGTIAAAFRDHRGSTLAAALLTASPIAIVYLKPALFFLAHEGTNPLGFPELSLTFALSQMVLALQFTPGGVGIFEGGQVGIYSIVGVKAPVALAYTALLRAVEAALCLIGAWLAARFGVGMSGGEAVE